MTGLKTGLKRLRARTVNDGDGGGTLLTGTLVSSESSDLTLPAFSAASFRGKIGESAGARGATILDCGVVFLDAARQGGILILICNGTSGGPSPTVSRFESAVGGCTEATFPRGMRPRRQGECQLLDGAAPFIDPLKINFQEGSEALASANMGHSLRTRQDEVHQGHCACLNSAGSAER